MTAPIIAEIANFVSKGAPLLGSVLGTPLAGIGLSLLGKCFDVDPKSTDKLLDAITNDPEALAKLRALEYEHQDNLQKIAATNYATEVDDRKNARQREINLHDYVPTILAIGFLFNYAAIQFYCVTHPTTINDIISARFQDVLIMIMSYYFGSSHKNKDEK